MTRTISLTAVLAVAALVLAVPAFGSPDTDELISNGLSQGVGPQYPPDVIERAAAAHQLGQTSPVRYSDSASTAIEHAVLANEQSRHEAALRYSDSADGARSAGTSPDVTTPVTPAPTTTVSGSEIEWPQIGLGIGFGVLLALGIWLAMRFVRVRPLAH